MATDAAVARFRAYIEKRLGEAEPLPEPERETEPVEITPRGVADRYLIERPPMLYHRDGYYLWTGRCYRQVQRADMLAILQRFVRDREWVKRDGTVAPGQATRRLVSDALGVLEGAAHVPDTAQPPCWLPADTAPAPSPGGPPAPDDGPDRYRDASRVLVLRNGLLDVDALAATGDERIGAHRGDLFATNALPYAADLTEKPQAPRWTAFLDRVMPDPDLQDMLAQWCGYCLIPTQAYQRVLLMHGEGQNGKTIFTEVLRRLVGEANVSSVSLDDLHTPHMVEPMVGKLLNISDEGDYIERRGLNLLKRVSGGGEVTVNPKHRAGYSVYLPTRFVLLLNEPPRVADRSDAIWRRLLVAPFDVRIPDAEKRPSGELVAELCEELPGILRWALTGLLVLQQQGDFTEPEAALRAKRIWRRESNPAGEFCSEYLEPSGDGQAEVAEVYRAYRRYCQEGGYKALNRVHFGREVVRWWRRQDAGPWQGRAQVRSVQGRYTVYRGISLRPEAAAIGERTTREGGDLL